MLVESSLGHSASTWFWSCVVVVKTCCACVAASRSCNRVVLIQTRHARGASQDSAPWFGIRSATLGFHLF